MKADLVLVTHEVRQLAATVTDLAVIAAHINRVHKTNYHSIDIEKILAGIKPTASIPRSSNGSKITSGPPISFHRPIATNANGIDPLAVATNAYLAKHADKIRESLR